MTIPFPAPERWLPIPGFEGFYEVSDFGRVRSVARTVVQKNGRAKTLKGKIIRPDRKRPSPRLPAAKAYHRVYLWRDNTVARRYVHRLVLEAFVGPCPPGQEGCHGDDDESNNHLDNLRWDTQRGNVNDRYGRLAA